MNFKRVWREFKDNLLKNISFILLIALSVMIIVGFNRAMDGYIATAHTLYQEYNVEDGHFSIYGMLTNKQKLSMERRFNVVIEENKSIDYNLETTRKAKKESQKDRILRTICVDRDINKLAIISGSTLENVNDIVVDPKFAEANHYEIGDALIISNNIFYIVGYGISPEYVYTLKNSGDFLNSPQTFGVAYVNAKGFEKINNNRAKSTLYSYQSKSGNITHLKEYLQKNMTLLSFRDKYDNARIQTVFDDANAPKQLSLMIGVLLVIIVAFIISISIKNTIRAESQTIGILYAQGFNEKELINYYIRLPSLLVLLGSLVGYGLGIIISRPLIFTQEGQYTLPYVELTDSWYLIIIGGMLPTVIALGITFVSLSKALHKTPLSLLNGNHSNNKVSKIEKIFTFKNVNFLTRFRLKDIIRERGSIAALLFGVLLAMMILSTAAHIRDSAHKYVADLEENVPFTYLYTFIEQRDLSKYSTKGEKTVLKDVKVNIEGSKKSLLIQGIRLNSQFFKIPGIEALTDNQVFIAPCLMAKFNIKVGDSLTLIDDLENKEYEVNIHGVAGYDYGQYIYTNIKTFNKIFNIHKQSYNALVTHESIAIPEEKMSSLMNKTEMINGAQNLLSMIDVMAGILVIVAVAILSIVVYMLMQMIIAKGKVNISMVKIFGYTPSEVNKLYLRGNFVILMIAFILAIPTGYFIAKLFFDSVTANMQQYIMTYIKPLSVFGAFIIMTLSYGGTCLFLKRNLEQVSLTEALKNRE